MIGILKNPLYLLIVVVIGFFILSELGLIPGNVVGPSFSNYNECIKAKEFYIFCGCTCPVEGYNCQEVNTQPPGNPPRYVYALHCGGCPSTFNKCQADWEKMQNPSATTTTVSYNPSVTTTTHPTSGTTTTIKQTEIQSLDEKLYTLVYKIINFIKGIFK